jgi:GNAT superfamily N-acetyltransferase
MGVPEAVARLALSPFRELPLPRNVRPYDLEGARMLINPYPTAQVAYPLTAILDVSTAVEQARAVARENEKTIVAWWIVPEHDAIVPQLEALGLVNEDTPGFEATENAMALIDPPPGPGVDGVEVRPTVTFDDYRASMDVLIECFGFPELPEEEIRARYDEYMADDVGQSFVAVVDGRVVGHAYAAFARAGLNLFGGAVVAAARGRGVYRALLQARWDAALERGTPALTVQAGRMSRPICERMGFAFVDAARVFVDSLD